MFLESEQALLPMPLLVVVTSWLVTIFISFGIFAPPNPTVVLTLIICALAVSAAIFIIMEMYSPFSGVLRISSAPVRDALNQMAGAR
jgi:formate hydrogenlyase subunit 4